MTLLVACGLKREARWLHAEGVEAVAGGGDEAALEAALEAAVPRARAIMSVGFAGGLAPRMAAGEWVVGTIAPTGMERREWSVGAGASRTKSTRIGEARPEPGQQSEETRRWIHALSRILGGVVVGRIHGSRAIVASVAEKHALHLSSRAVAVDMESHVAARVAARHGLPFAVARVISDAADRALPPAIQVAMGASGGLAVGAILLSILRRPWQVPALLRFTRDAWRAGRVLRQGWRRLAAAGFGLDPA
ncbi:phosphorylase [Sphingomonas sp.]|uniref:phosphorylase family protein n=1 Tax=Sphingomonas sp. TaxID=28214 RepID=UPI003B0021F3